MDPGFLNYAKVRKAEETPGELAKDSDSQPPAPPEILRAGWGLGTCICNKHPMKSQGGRTCGQDNRQGPAPAPPLSERSKADSVPISKDVVVHVPQVKAATPEQQLLPS